MEIARNKKARFNYEIIEDFEAGIVLTGTEVKSLRQKKVNIGDAYATISRDELYLTNARIEPYSHGTHSNHEPERPRKLLMKRKEIEKLRGKLNEKGLALLPLKMYFNNKGIVKVLLGLGKGKKMHDKRQTIKERDIKRDTERELKNWG